jgi:hypothetical protein
MQNIYIKFNGGFFSTLKCMLAPKTLVFACKKLEYSCTQKKTKFQLKKNANLNNHGVRSRLAFPENESFFSVSNLMSSHKA